MEDADFSLNPDAAINPYRFNSITEGGSILSSPVIHNGKIIFGCNDTHVYCLDREGDKIWSAKTGGIVFSSPTIYKDSILIGSNDGYLYSISLDGEIRWKALTGDRIYSTPLVVEDVVYFGSNDGFFRALSAEDGRELWKYYHSAGYFFMSASAANDSIFCGHINGSIFCLSKEGKLVWKIMVGDHVAQTPLILSSNNNILCSFNKRSLEKFPHDGNCKLFSASGDGFFRCIDAGTGSIDWKFFCDKAGASSPDFWNNLIYFGSTDGKVNAVNAKGKLDWRYQTGNKIVSSPTISDGTLHIGSSDHNIYALDAKTGQLKWRFLTNGEVISSPVIENNILYVGSWDCHIYAINTITKELLWRFRTSMSTPSFIPKPEMKNVQEKHTQHLEFAETKTTIGHEVEKQYSVQTGELTNVFYDSPVTYNRKKTIYDFDSQPDKYKR